MYDSSTRTAYEKWRRINRTLNDRLVDGLSRADFLSGARALGLAQGRAIEVDENEFMVLMDYCIYHLRAKDKRSPVERLAASNANLTLDETRVLGQMCQARFRLMAVFDEPDNHIFEVTDVLRTETIRFADIGMSMAWPGKGTMILANTIRSDLDGVWATTGAPVPIQPEDFLDILSELDRVVPPQTKSLRSLSTAKWEDVARLSLKTALSIGCAQEIEMRDPWSMPRLAVSPAAPIS